MKLKLSNKVLFFFDGWLLVTLFMIPGHAYEWMEQMNPGMEQLPEDPNRDVRLFITLAFLIFVVALHVYQLVVRKAFFQRIQHSVIIVVLTFLWAWKFVF